MYRLLCPLALCIAAPAQAATKPRPAHGRFATNNYTLTFIAPPGVSYCPIAKNWIVSDHGTILFLVPPRRCTGAGYSASDRGATPDGLPFISVYYGFSDLSDSPPPPCRKVGVVVLFGRPHALCADRADGMITRTVTGLYRNDTGNQVSLSLVTTPARLTRDMAIFTRLVGSIRTCTSDMILPGGKHFGHGSPCGRGDFY